MTGFRTTSRCTHCGLDAGPDPRLAEGKVFCCAGCEAVYAILHDAGLGAFYEAGGVGSLAARRGRAAAGSAPSPPAFAPLDAAGAAELDVVGMRCASCAWLIERYIGRRPGVADVRVSYATATASRSTPCQRKPCQGVGQRHTRFSGRPSGSALRS